MLINVNDSANWSQLIGWLLLCMALSVNSYGQNITSQQNNSTVLQLSLEEAQNYAVENNLNARISRFDVDNARGQVTEVRAMGLPQVNAALSVQHNLRLPAQLVPGEFFGQPEQEFLEIVFGTKNNLTAGVEFTQLLFDGSYLLGLKAAQKFVERAQLQTEQSEYEVRTGIAETYLAYLVAKENLATLDQNVAVIDRVLFETTQLYQNGFVEVLEVDRLQLSKANLVVQIEDIQNNLIAIGLLLKFQLGVDLNQDIELTDSLEGLMGELNDVLNANVEELQKIAVDNRIELKLTEVQNIFRDLDIKQVKAQYLPNAVIFGQAQSQFQSNNFRLLQTEQWIPSSAVGLRINIPIFDGLQKKGQLQQRYTQQQQAFLQDKLLRESIKLEVERAQLQYLNAYQKLKNQESNIALAQKIYDTTLIKYKEGVGSSLEVTNAESALYQTQGQYINALYDVALAQQNLKKALGQ